jgi:hypothetical protein
MSAALRRWAARRRSAHAMPVAMRRWRARRGDTVNQLGNRYKSKTLRVAKDSQSFFYSFDLSPVQTIKPSVSLMMI